MPSQSTNDECSSSDSKCTISSHWSGYIVPRLPFDPTSSDLPAAGSQELQAANMTRNITSSLDDDPYDEIESIEAQTDEEASTVSVDDSTVGDESNADTLSDFAYDSDGGHDVDGQTLGTYSLADLSEPTPIGLSQVENEQLATDSLFISTHTDATEQLEKEEVEADNLSYTPSMFYRAWRNELLDLKHRLKASPTVQNVLRSFESSFHPGQVIGYISAILVAGLVAAIMRTALYDIISITSQPSTLAGGNLFCKRQTTLPPNAAKVMPKQQIDTNENTWTFEPLQQTRDMLNKLTSSRPDSMQSKGIQPTDSNKSKAPKHPKFDRRPTLVPKPSMKDLSHRLPSAIQKHLSRDYGYVSLRDGTLFKVKGNSKPADSRLLGPLNLMKGSTVNFKIHYDKVDFKIRIARTEKSSPDAPAHIIVSSGGKILQRGSLSGGNILHWAPSVIPAANRYGTIRVLFVQLTEASVQESFVDLGPVPADATLSALQATSSIDSDIHNVSIKDSLKRFVDLYLPRLPLQTMDKFEGYTQAARTLSIQLLARAQQRVLLIKARVRSVLHKADDDMLDKVHACKNEVMTRAKKAQRRSKNLREFLENKYQALRISLDDVKIDDIQSVVASLVKKVIG